MRNYTLSLRLSCRAVLTATAILSTCTTLQAGSVTTGNVVPNTAPSTWTGGTDVSVGYAQFSTGSLTINVGSGVTSRHATIGNQAQSNGTATITGNGSTWRLSSRLAVGYLGNGSLAIRNGGLVKNGSTSGTSYYNATIGSKIGSNGSALISGVSGGTRSTWQLSDLTVGYESKNATLNVADGGVVGSRYGYIGSQVGSEGNATIRGISGSNRSEWVNWRLYVGKYGAGSLRVLEGGLVRSTSYGMVGEGSKAVGSVLVSGVNGGNRSTWGLVGDLTVGENGAGSMQVKDGGLVLSKGGLIGRSGSFGSTGTGVVRVAGVSANSQRSTWEMSEGLGVGSSAFENTGTLSIEQGGLVKSLSGSIGHNDGKGDVTVAGVRGGFQSAWEISQNLRVYSDGTLQINDGGLVTVDGGVSVDNRTDVKLAFGIGDNGSGLLDAVGDVELDGLFEVDLLGSFVPQLGDSFTLIKSKQGSITGLTNAELLALLPTKGGTIGWSSDYVAGGKEMTITVASAVPEPSSLLLAGLGLVGLGLRRRR